MCVCVLQQLCFLNAELELPTWCQGSCHTNSKHTHTQTNTARKDCFCVCVCLCLLQRGRERGSCSIKPSSTVPLDCPICLATNTQTHTHTLMHTHGPSVVLSAAHGKLHTQWDPSRQWCVFSDVSCEENMCVSHVWHHKTPFVAFSFQAKAAFIARVIHQPSIRTTHEVIVQSGAELKEKSKWSISWKYMDEFRDYLQNKYPGFAASMCPLWKYSYCIVSCISAGVSFNLLSNTVKDENYIQSAVFCDVSCWHFWF